ncbi:transport system permease [Mycolicibacterium phlei]|jgi:iron complex transport system permease protein|uniref:ABC transporter permease n=1 Tax=Mycolicibacterium phlei DSM 43239 = CCUG 21000 TaxID=1226750 RepID=A0A5N5VEP7_MYCPH|nr:iron ABC transporter permease [Mycolicibacterium phlei]VEG07445.1 transport system permease [Mycobacteroides chelonae]AMO59313.1 Hemin transport system permease protein HmuU [Mycolicibacterium phlei]EID13723.1 Fe uptake system integral membrane protein [Mycolicibacterium phlei RIVM601174]KAB7758959.1 ABC transporter permease [Mycolicibacterium phlei DSM 43239 = CCUG 21000]KXW59829.1 ABC transporter permease [Mycolicibacterium phlei DSM 43072]
MVRYPVVLTLLAVLLVATATTGVAVGSVAVPAAEVWQILLHRVLPRAFDQTWSPARAAIVLDARLPRVLLAALVGAGLAVCGMVLQAVVRNPLADPMLLGVSSGASVGAVLVLVAGVGAGLVAMPLAAFLGALGALVAVYLLARTGGRMTTIRLILAGVAVAEVLSAVASLLIVTSDDPHKAQSAVRWLLGGLGGATWSTLWVPTLVVLVGVGVLLAVTRSLNLLYSGEEAATTLGLDVHRFRAAMFVVVALMVGAMVAVTGAIGFVGLIMPHVVRMLVGADHRRALPAAALLGASFLIACDIAARTVAAPEELPVGILTALVGGPYFLWLMRRRAPA